MEHGEHFDSVGKHAIVDQVRKRVQPAGVYIFPDQRLHAGLLS
jgi:hypothetical protein